MASFVGTSTPDSFIGTDLTADQFNFPTTQLSAADTVSGGSGREVSQADTLSFLNSASINFGTLPNIEGIEVLKLASGSNIVRLTHALASTAAGKTINVVGNSGADSIDASGLNGFLSRDKLKALSGLGHDTIRGGGGLDTLNGGSGNDLLYGLHGRDSLMGALGNDKLFGGAAGDVLAGGAGADTLIGGTGADTFIYASVAQSGISSGTTDKIRDFVAGIDRIDVSSIESNSIGLNNHFDFIGTAVFSQAGQIRVVQSGTDTLVKINMVGVTDAEMIIRLQGVTASELSAADFLPPTFSGQVTAASETDAVQGSGDVADDPAIWINKDQPGLSAIIGTDKDGTTGGLYVYGMGGKALAKYESGTTYNNVDLRYDFKLGVATTDLIGVTNRSNDHIDFFTIDPATRALTAVGSIATGLSKIYGFTMYHSADDKFYALATTTSGTVRQFELDGSSGNVTGSIVRTFDVGSQAEGLAVDDGSGSLFVSEESTGIWKYDADPSGGAVRALVDSVGTGHLTSDVEGLTVYYAADGKGYLLASSQGSSSYAVYDRQTLQFVGKFSIGAGNGVDAVTSTDGIDVTNASLGSGYSKGLLVVHDNNNDTTSTTNFKFIPWEDVASLGGLIVDTQHDPTIEWQL